MEETMNVLLINPGWMIRSGNIWKKIEGSMPPLGLAYIASYLEKNSINVRIIDIDAGNVLIVIILSFSGNSYQGLAKRRGYIILSDL